MHSRTFFALACLLGSLASVRPTRATDVYCPVTVYFTEQWDTYAEFNWQCIYGVDYVYVSPMANGSRPNWYTGLDYYWGSWWSGYIDNGYWQPYFYFGCDWVLAGIYDVYLAEIPNTTAGRTYRLTIHYDDNSTWYGDLGSSGAPIQFSDIQAFYTDKRAISASAAEKIVISVDSITGADLIGDDGVGNVHYATNQHASNEVVIQLSVSPSNANITVNWSGGVAGANQLQRKVSRASLNYGGEQVTADVCGDYVFNGTFHTYKAPPGAASVVLNQSIVRDDSIVQMGMFGLCQHILSPSFNIPVYYENGKFKFSFQQINYTTKWGAISALTDIPTSAVNSNPFPLGYAMSPSSSEYQKKSQAKTDLTPDSGGVAPRSKYWAKAITEVHENFHISDFRDNYFTAALAATESWLEAQEIDVEPNLLDPNEALDSILLDLDDRISSDLEDQLSLFLPESETRAYSDGKALYTSLSNSITP